jgi:hypothetical protein
VLSGVNPDDDVHAASVPDSNPSPNSGGVAAGVVADALVLSTETLLDASRALTV